MLAADEVWNGNQEVIDNGSCREVRFEPGDEVEQLPKLTNLEFFKAVGAVEIGRQSRKAKVTDG
jgi:hypothetical protein